MARCSDGLEGREVQGEPAFLLPRGAFHTLEPCLSVSFS